MKILIIDIHSPSPHAGDSDRHHSLAKQWGIMGHKVTILTASFSPIRKENSAINKDFQKITVDENVEQVYFKIPKYDVRFKNSFKHAQWVFLSKFRLHYLFFKRLNRYDVVIINSAYPNLILPIYKPALKKKIRLYFDITEPWPLAAVERYGCKTSIPNLKKMAGNEAWCYAYAQKVIASGEFVKSHLVFRGITGSEFFEYIPDGIDVSLHPFDGKLSEETFEVFKDIRDRKKLILTTFDDEINTPTIETLLEAAPSIDDGLCLMIAALPENKEKYAKIISDKSLYDKVKVVDKGTDAELDALLEYSDFLYYGAEKHPLYRYGVVFTQLLRCMLVGQPIVYAFEGSNDPVTEVGCGITVETKNPQALSQGINDLLGKSLLEYRQFCENAKGAALSEYDYRVLAKRYSDLFELEYVKLPKAQD